MTEENLKNIIQACRKNDRQSQKQLYKHFFNYGMTICMRYAMNREEAKEILNDSFIKVFSKLDKYDNQLSFKAWMNRIIVNTSIDSYRKRKTQPQTIDIVYAQHHKCESDVVAKLSAKEIMALVQKLPNSYRMVFILHVVEGYKHPEIAEKLNIAVGTSKSNLAKARVKLMAMISNRDKVMKYGS